MKFLFVSHWSGSGGAEKALFEIIEYAHSKLGVECICLVNGRGSLYRKLCQIGVRCYVLPYRWWCGENLPRWKTIGRSVANLPLAVAAAVIIAAQRCQLVYTNTSTVSVGALAAFLSHRPHIWHIHELPGARQFDMGERFSMSMMNRLTRTFIVPSDFIARALAARIDPRKIVTIRNAVRLADQATNIPRRTPTPGRLVSIGAVCRQKGHEDAVRAAAELARRGHDVTLRIVGNIDDAVYKQELEAIAAELGLGARLSFAGLLPDIVPEMQEAQIFVMCGRDEGFGRVTVEAMLLHRPVVAVSSGATSEIVKHNETGLLCSPGSPSELADAIEQLLARPDFAIQMADRAFETAVGYYTLERFFRQWTDAVYAAASESQSDHSRDA